MMMKTVFFLQKRKFFNGTVVGFLKEHHMFSPYTPKFIHMNLGVSFKNIIEIHREINLLWQILIVRLVEV